MNNHYDLIPSGASPQQRAALMQAMDDPANEGAFGKYASDDLRQKNVYNFLQGQPLGFGEAGHGNWLQHHSGVLNAIAPGTSAMGRATDRIWNSRIGDWAQRITPKPLRSQLRTGLNLAASGFFPGTLGGYSGLAADYGQQGDRALMNAAEHGAMFATAGTTSGAGGIAGTGLSTGSALGNTVATGALSGAVQGGAGAYVNGGNVWGGLGAGALTGAVGSGVGAGVTGVAGPIAGSAASGLATGALRPALAGGNSRDIWGGALTGGAAGAVGSGIGGYTGNRQLGGVAGNLTGQLVSSLLQNPQQFQPQQNQQGYPQQQGYAQGPPPEWAALMQSMQGGGQSLIPSYNDYMMARALGQ